MMATGALTDDEQESLFKNPGKEAVKEATRPPDGSSEARPASLSPDPPPEKRLNLAASPSEDQETYRVQGARPKATRPAPPTTGDFPIGVWEAVPTASAVSVNQEASDSHSVPTESDEQTDSVPEVSTVEIYETAEENTGPSNWDDDDWDNPSQRRTASAQWPTTLLSLPPNYNEEEAFKSAISMSLTTLAPNLSLNKIEQYQPVSTMVDDNGKVLEYVLNLTAGASASRDEMGRKVNCPFCNWPYYLGPAPTHGQWNCPKWPRGSPPEPRSNFGSGSDVSAWRRDAAPLPNRWQESRSTETDGAGGLSSAFDGVQIPCEFCRCLFDVRNLNAHQLMCSQNPSNFK